mmetsp:Transcript_104328/g.336393  ORF Transcript_104328/g.336393 Transcript_104328/m.336393 type:complete len:200 (+) Transcript_104328:122-721(+)
MAMLPSHNPCKRRPAWAHREALPRIGQRMQGPGRNTHWTRRSQPLGNASSSWGGSGLPSPPSPGGSTKTRATTSVPLLRATTSSAGLRPVRYASTAHCKGSCGPWCQTPGEPRSTKRRLCACWCLATSGRPMSRGSARFSAAPPRRRVGAWAGGKGRPKRETSASLWMEWGLETSSHKSMVLPSTSVPTTTRPSPTLAA